MVYGVYFSDNRGKTRILLKDDLVSRQSITVRDAKAMGFKREGEIILIEGSEDAIKKAEEILGENAKVERMEEYYKKFKEEEENAAVGMGTIFDS